MADTQLEVSFPLDPEGFISKECPLCKMRFRIYLNDFDSKIKEKDEVLCPYCGLGAYSNEPWTPEQVKFMQDILHYRILEPEVEKLKGELKKSKLKSKFISVDVNIKREKARKPISPKESNNMRIVNFPCCDINIKIENNCEKFIYCFYCGKA